MSTVSVGVLALQGASAPHLAAFARLGLAAREVRSPAELAAVTHLVLPGGESTTIAHLLRLFGLWEPIRARHAEGSLALFGTCAGAILLSRGADGPPPTLGLLATRVERNAYGRQRESCERELETDAELGSGLSGVFIRAPRFVAPDPALRVLARLDGEPIALEAPGLLATTFHPELGRELAFHARFVRA
ncbi:MAG: pyridoxal 5'-phosphate synthase glutaminase subunit PdxT [Planctomycetota bacterium]